MKMFLRAVLLSVFMSMGLVAQNAINVSTNLNTITNMFPNPKIPSFGLFQPDGSSWLMYQYVPSASSGGYPTITGSGRWLETPITGDAVNMGMFGTTYVANAQIIEGTVDPSGNLHLGYNQRTSYFASITDNAASLEFVAESTPIVVTNIATLLSVPRPVKGRQAIVETGTYYGGWNYCPDDLSADNGTTIRRPDDVLTDLDAGRWVKNGIDSTVVTAIGNKVDTEDGSATNLNVFSALTAVQYPFLNFDTIWFFGDSITYGANATSLTNSYSGRFASTLPRLSYFNSSRGSANVTAFSYQILPGYVHPDPGYSSSPAAITNTMLIDVWGDYNGMRDWGNSSTYIPHHEHTLRAIAIYAAQATTNLILGQSSYVTNTGSWSSMTNYGGAMGIVSTNVGDSTTFAVTGDTAYVTMLAHSGTNGVLDTTGSTFSVTIDSISKGTFANYLAFGSRKAYSPGDTNDPVALFYAPWAYRFPGLGSGTHLITVSIVTGDPSKPVGFMFASGDNSQKYVQGYGPFVFINKVIQPTVAGGVSLTTPALIRTAMGNFHNIETKIAGELAQDGFPVALVDPTAYYNNNTVTDNVHPDNTGHLQIATARVVSLAQRDLGAAGIAAIVRPANINLPSEGAVLWKGSSGSFTSSAIYGTNNGLTTIWKNTAAGSVKSIVTRSDAFPFYTMDLGGGSFAGVQGNLTASSGFTASSGEQDLWKINTVLNQSGSASGRALHIDLTTVNAYGDGTNTAAPLVMSRDSGANTLYYFDANGNVTFGAMSGSTRSLFLSSTNSTYSAIRLRYGLSSLDRTLTMDGNSIDVSQRSTGSAQTLLLQASGGNVTAAGSYIQAKTLSAASGVEAPLQIINPTSQTGSAGVDYVLINPTITTVGTGVKNFQLHQLNSTNLFMQSIWGDFVSTPLSTDTTNRYLILKPPGTTRSGVTITYNENSDKLMYIGGDSLNVTNNSGIPQNLKLSSNDGKIVIGQNGTAFGNYRHGRATLVSGIATVSINPITSSYRFVGLVNVSPSGTIGFLCVSNIVTDTSFQIVSSNSGDTSNVDWAVVTP